MRIKFVSKTPVDRLEALWSAFLPREGIGTHSFTFDPDDRDYDFLAVYEDLPPLPGERRIMRSERLACPPDHTVLFVTEPTSIRIDGLHYLSQYGRIATSRRFSDEDGQTLWDAQTFPSLPPVLVPFYGRDMDGDAHIHIDTIADEMVDKPLGLSTVTSNKAMDHTVHAQRLDFVRALKARMGDDLDLFGRGIEDIAMKRDAMRPYRYHLAIENHVQRGHFTEKLTDCFLARCLPFYFGDPTASSVFPRQAMIPIDIFDIDGAEATIRAAMAGDEWSKRRNALETAREITLDLANPLRAAARFADSVATTRIADAKRRPRTIHGRHAFRRAHPVRAAQDALYRARAQRSPLANPLQDVRLV